MIYLTISLILMLFIVIYTIFYGINKKKNQGVSSKGTIKKALGINIALFILVVTVAILVLVPKIALGLTGTIPNAESAIGAVNPSAGLGYLACGLCTGLACIGAGYAVGQVGSAALGVVSEDQTLLGKTLIYVGLAEGIAIYGLLISIMILSRL